MKNADDIADAGVSADADAVGAGVGGGWDIRARSSSSRAFLELSTSRGSCTSPFFRLRASSAVAPSSGCRTRKTSRTVGTNGAVVTLWTLWSQL